MNSVWSASAALPHFDILHGDISTDVLIIGGGLAGILCAQRLKEAGVACVVAEASSICSGITKDTTAKITSQHGLIYHKIIKKYGTERAQMYLTANEAALARYRSLCAAIDCDFSEQNSYAYSLTSPEKLVEELDALNALHFPCELVDDLPLPFSTAGAVRFPKQAQFHPLKFLCAIAKDLPIYENTPVRELIGCTAVTDFGRIKAEKIIITTHFPFLNKHGSYFLKLYQHRSYVTALENAPAMEGMYIDGSGSGLSFRSHDGMLLLGGGSHRTGKQGGGWRTLEAFAKQHYPGSACKYRWATQDCMTLDGIPYIGQYSKRTPQLYVATGFNKWGMTSAMAAADILTDMVTGNINPTAEVFSPSRSILHPQLAVNAVETTVNLLTPTAKRCPHLGCALKWNPAEHSWDCPCHGSRFTERGKLIDNPATGDLKPR